MQLTQRTKITIWLHFNKSKNRSQHTNDNWEVVKCQSLSPPVCFCLSVCLSVRLLLWLTSVEISIHGVWQSFYCACFLYQVFIARVVSCQETFKCCVVEKVKHQIIILTLKILIIHCVFFFASIESKQPTNAVYLNVNRCSNFNHFFD